MKIYLPWEGQSEELLPARALALLAQGGDQIYAGPIPSEVDEIVPLVPQWLVALWMAGGWKRTPLTLVDAPVLCWDALAEQEGTLVVTPRAGSLKEICRALEESACPGPFKLILHPGAPGQSERSLDCDDPAENWLVVSGPPAVAPWHQHLPLYGQKIVVTREAESARAWVSRLRALGAEVRLLPTLDFEPPTDPGPLTAALARLSDYDWVIFTSVNGVRFFLQALRTAGGDLRQLGRARLAAIGPATAAALEAVHLRADIVPPSFVAESLLAALVETNIDGQRILIPRAEEAREVLPDGLREAGARVEVVPAYRTVGPSRPHEPPTAGEWVTFASSSSVRNFQTLVGPTPDLLAVTIGPVTAASAREAGFRRVETAEVYTLDGLTAKLIELAGMPIVG